MLYIIISGSAFLMLIFSHSIAFRFGFVKFEPFRLAALFSFWLIFYLVTVFFLLNLNHKEASRSIFLTPFVFTSITLYVLASVWYFGQLIAVQYWSPSMKVINKIMKSRDRKVSQGELKNLFSNKELITSRLSDLVHSGYIEYKDGVYMLQPKGSLVCYLIKGYRRLLGRDVGG